MLKIIYKNQLKFNVKRKRDMKKIRLLKRLIIFALVLILCTASFGAIISGDDGKAFITKDELMMTIDDFDNIINQYESSLDGKIQGAIASYLDGIIIQNNPKNLYNQLKNTIGNKNPYFLNSAPTGSDALTSDVIVTKRKNYSTQYIMKTTITKEAKIEYVTLKGKRSSGSMTVNLLLEHSPTYTFPAMQTYPMTVSNTQGVTIMFPVWSGQSINLTYAYNDTSSRNLGTLSAGTTKDISSELNLCTAGKNGGFIFYESQVAKGGECTIMNDFTTGSTWVSSYSLTGDLMKPKPADITTTTEQTYQLNNLVQASATRDGSGSQWTYELNPDGSKSLNRYWTTFYPRQSITLNYKTFKDYGTKTTAVAANDLKDDNVCTYEPSIDIAYGKVTTGTDYSVYSTTNQAGYCEEIFSLVSSSTDDNDYRTAQWGNNVTSDIYASTESPSLVEKTTNLNTWTDLAESSVTIAGVTHTTTKVTNNIKEVTINPETIALNTFVNNYYTGVAGETVKMGYGIPIMITNADAGATYSITIPVKQTVAPEGTVSASGDVTARLSLNHFVNGNFATPDDKIWEETISCDSSGIGSATFTVDSIPKNQQLWLNLYGNTASRIVELTGFNVNMS